MNTIKLQELLEKVEENSSGEEQWESHFRYLSVESHFLKVFTVHWARVRRNLCNLVKLLKENMIY